MSSIFVRPLPFSVSSSSGWTAANPVAFANIDHPGMVAKSSGNSASFTVSLGSSQSIDAVALIGSNLPSTAIVTVVAGSYSSGSTVAFVGTKDDTFSTKTIFQFTPVSTASVTVTITASAPFEFQRLVIGKRIEIDGIDQNCDQFFEDQSVIESGPGFTTVEEYNTLMGWKAKASWVSDQKWRDEFAPFLTRVGMKKAVLFIPKSDAPLRFQHEACFGRFTAMSKGEHPNSDNWILNFQITSLAP